MNTFKPNLLVLLMTLLLAVLLSACSKNDEVVQSLHDAVAIESADECHLCGMLISNFSGPKGELFRKGLTQAEGNSVKKFCSTRDMFSFYLDPENKRNVTTMLVHDMSKSPWETPKDQYFIDAHSAWFVAGSIKTGAMGKTLASFSKQKDAQAFAAEFGGKVIDFTQVDLSVLM
ncbi:nitrous oxide reductase accessory protein NosL [Colwellia hornerae]|uniref:Nitrous oxide reductase accessory protein NosL n=1 Tax=Colwellia hornerae TaxID=89402 RepID=A0A5C6QB30_9GAMM|nr:nitrous oxide reductase accessory protein NosL [Colwellia hornerae]TWX51118.1 nitrous oxide reductase accessory protein NosL [Colwellia hornerae]TWX56794.1 nitrous oxide reductase accessory protein NosL [Colwellia hornerae]TWX66038.1 nitrous oxide reductase accessory protein NosL [Colwellia hornerae]